MKLILAEKKVLAELIADSIDGRESKGNGCIYKGNYCITWASGHLLTLKEPEDYDPELKKWSLDALPIYFDNWGVKPIPFDGRGKSAADRLKDIKGLLDDSECVIHAGDPDDEGQLLIDEILRFYKYRKPIYRMETGDTTRASLQAALAHLKNNRDCEAAGWAAYARSVADMTFGINLSRYFTLNNKPAKLTVGRVQTPALALVVAREEQIQGHTKQLYYTVEAVINVNGKLIRCKYEPRKDDPNLTDGKILDQAYANQIANSIRGKTLSGVTISEKTVTESPPLPFNLVRLQSYCGKLFGYSPSDTLKYSQELRDGYNAISYNRTSCQYLSDNHFDEAPTTMRTVIKNIRYKPPRLDMTIRSKCFDSSKIEAHHGIIPQNVAVDVGQLAEPLRNLYLAVCKYYIVQFMPPAIKRKTRLEVPLPDGGKLVGNSTVIEDDGYLTLFKKIKEASEATDEASEEETSPLSELSPGTYSGIVVDTQMQERETKPPARYTQVTLNEDMTRISKYVKDPEVKRLLLEKDKEKKDANGSIGTDATRADIIKNLISRGFMEEQGKSKHLVPTPLGKELIRIVPDEAKKPDITGYWWAIQDDIIHGLAQPEALMHNVRDMVIRMLKTEYPHVDPAFLPKKNGENTIYGREILGTCPWCGKPVIENDKVGFYGCTGWKDGCQFKIWKKPRGHLFEQTTFTAENVKAFLSGKPVKKTKLLSKTDSVFTADIVLKQGQASDFPKGVEFDLKFSDKRPKKRSSKSSKRKEG